MSKPIERVSAGSGWRRRLQCAMAASVLVAWERVARADLDFSKMTTEVESMKSDFLGLLKVVLGAVAVVIVVKGVGGVAKKLSTNDPSATWHLVAVGGAAAVLLIAIALI